MKSNHAILIAFAIVLLLGFFLLIIPILRNSEKTDFLYDFASLPIGPSFEYTGSIQTYLGKANFKFLVQCEISLNANRTSAKPQLIKIQAQKVPHMLQLADGSFLRFWINEACHELSDDISAGTGINRIGYIDWLSSDQDMAERYVNTKFSRVRDAKWHLAWERQQPGLKVFASSLKYSRAQVSRWSAAHEYDFPEAKQGRFVAVYGVKIPYEVWSENLDIVDAVKWGHSAQTEGSCYIQLNRDLQSHIYTFVPHASLPLFGGSRPYDFLHGQMKPLDSRVAPVTWNLEQDKRWHLTPEADPVLRFYRIDEKVSYADWCGVDVEISRINRILSLSDSSIYLFGISNLLIEG